MTTNTRPQVLPVGSKAPDFADVIATGGRTISLGQFKGKYLIMVFYPKDQTPGCTRQLCALRDDAGMFAGLDTEIIGVNPDSLDSHERFAQKQNYPFPILVDESACIARDYGALKPEGGIQRTVYIIDPEGNVLFAEQGMPEDETLAAVIRNHRG